MTPDQMAELAARLRTMTTATMLDEYDMKAAADLIESMAQRVPLTDEQIDAALKTDPAMVPALMIGELTVGEFKIVLRRLARAIEQAHGIRSDK